MAKKPSFFRPVEKTEYGVCCEHGHFIPGPWIPYRSRYNKMFRDPSDRVIRARRDTLSCGHQIVKESRWGVPKRAGKRICKECLLASIEKVNQPEQAVAELTT